MSYCEQCDYYESDYSILQKYLRPADVKDLSSHDHGGCNEVTDENIFTAVHIRSKVSRWSPPIFSIEEAVDVYGIPNAAEGHPTSTTEPSGANGA